MRLAAMVRVSCVLPLKHPPGMLGRGLDKSRHRPVAPPVAVWQAGVPSP